MTQTWVDVPRSEWVRFLGTLAVRGEGMVRAASVFSVAMPPCPGEDVTEVAEVVADVVDSRLGRWAVTFTGLRLLSGASGADRWLVVWDAFARGTWSVTWDDDAVPGGAGRVVVRDRWSRSELAFTGLVVRRAVLDGAPGACAACGGVAFRMRVSLSTPVRAVTGPDGSVRFVADAADAQELVDGSRIGAGFAKLVCTGCGVPAASHVIGGMDGVLVGDGPEGLGLRRPGGTALSALLASAGAGEDASSSS